LLAQATEKLPHKKGEHRDRTRPFPKAQVPEIEAEAQRGTGCIRAGSSRVRINKASLQKMPANGKRVRGRPDPKQA